MGKLVDAKCSSLLGPSEKGIWGRCFVEPVLGLFGTPVFSAFEWLSTTAEFGAFEIAWKWKADQKGSDQSGGVTKEAAGRH